MSEVQVTVQPGGSSFPCGPDETILQAATRSGLSLPFGCRKGNCGTCKAQVIDGETESDTESTYGLSEFEREQGFTLLCRSYALEPLTIELEIMDPAELAVAAPVGEQVGRVRLTSQRTPDTWQLDVELDTPVPFRSGQFADISIPGSGRWRSYSMAGPASRPGRYSFFIKSLPGGAFSTQLPLLRPDHEIMVRAPLGSFWLRPTQRPILLVSGGTGLGPVLSMLTQLAENADPRSVRFFHGARTAEDLFGLDEIRTIGAMLPDFKMVAAVSDHDESSSYAHGLVTDVFHQDLGSQVAEYDAYLCGPPGMIDSALKVLAEYGLRERHSIFYDKFSAS